MSRTDTTAVLTGATSGIGAAAAPMLARSFSHLVLHGPEDESEIGPLLEEVSRGGARVDYVSGDFTSLESTRATARRVTELASRLDVLVNNAGVPGAPRRRLTEDGIERTLQVNAIAPALLTAAVLPALAPDARVVNVSSTTHRMASLDLDDVDLAHGYSPVRAYSQSKLVMLIHTLALAEDPRMRGRRALAISPGVISTGLLHAMFGSGGAPQEHGAARIVDAVRGSYPSGSYVDDGEVVLPSDEARDPDRARWLVGYLRSLGVE